MMLRNHSSAAIRVIQFPHRRFIHFCADDRPLEPDQTMAFHLAKLRKKLVGIVVCKR